MGEIEELLRSLQAGNGVRSSALVSAARKVAQTETAEDKSWALLELAKVLANEGEWREAEAIARSIGGAQERAIALYEIGRYQISRSREEAGAALLRDAAVVADHIRVAWQKAEILCRIAKWLAVVGEHDEAQRIWHEAITVAREGEQSYDIQDSLDCSSVLGEIAVELALSGDVEQSRIVARTIKSDPKRADASKALTRILSKRS
jgi:tetratricopeptide (TPR) repeat protein